MKIGSDTKIYEHARIVNHANMAIGDGTMIDDYTFINGGELCRIGNYNHIEMFASITGGGRFESEDNVVIAAGARVLTATDTYQEGKHMTTALPESERSVKRSFVVIGRDAFIGTNAVIHPGVKIGEGAIVGSLSLVTHDIEPWTVNIGCPCRVIGMRQYVKKVGE